MTAFVFCRISRLGMGLMACLVGWGVQAQTYTSSTPYIPPSLPAAAVPQPYASAYGPLTPTAQAPAYSNVGLPGPSLPTTIPTAPAAATLQSLSDAVRLNPFDPVALNNLAVQYAAQGDYPSAIALLDRALRMAPGRSDIASNLQNLRAWMAQGAQAVPTGSGPGPLGSSGPFQPPVQAQDLPPVWSQTPLSTHPVATRQATPLTPSSPRAPSARRAITETREFQGLPRAQSSAPGNGLVVEGPITRHAAPHRSARSRGASRHGLAPEAASARPKSVGNRSRLLLDCPPT